MELIVRATVIYFGIWIVVRATGKRELSELTAFELVLLVALGDLIQQGVVQDDKSVVGALLALCTFAFWIVTFSFVSWRFRVTRPLLEGVPVVVVHDGRLLHSVMRDERLTEDDLKEAARGEGIRDLSEVDIAVLEPDGTLSFIKRDDEQHSGPKKHRAT